MQTQCVCQISPTKGTPNASFFGEAGVTARKKGIGMLMITFVPKIVLREKAIVFLKNIKTLFDKIRRHPDGSLVGKSSSLPIPCENAIPFEDRFCVAFAFKQGEPRLTARLPL
jgi:hypothetical protein